MSLKDQESIKLRNTNGFIDTANPLPVQISDGVDTADVIATNGNYGIVAIAPGHISTDNSYTTEVSALIIESLLNLIGIPTFPVLFSPEGLTVLASSRTKKESLIPKHNNKDFKFGDLSLTIFVSHSVNSSRLFHSFIFIYKLEYLLNLQTLFHLD